jgi:hypothetical protein
MANRPKEETLAAILDRIAAMREELLAIERSLERFETDPSFFSTPIVLNTATFFVKGTKVSGGPYISIPNCATGPYIPNNSCLLFLRAPNGVAACANDCIFSRFPVLGWGRDHVYG